MKQTIPFLSLAVILAACGNTATNNTDSATTNPAVQTAPTFLPDTVGLAEYQQWKAQNELIDEEDYTSTASYTAAPVKKAKKTYTAPVKRSTRTIASEDNSVSNDMPVSNDNQSVGNNGQNEDVSMSNETSKEAKIEEKKGWSKAAKGAVIGGAAGAAAGAAVNKKNRVVGAVIGGVVGAGGGYVIGRGMDKKDGRYLTPEFSNQ